MFAKLLSALVCAMALTVFSGERTDLPEAEWRRDFVISFDVRFAKGAPRDFQYLIYYPLNPKDKPGAWRGFKTAVSFVGWTRGLDWSSNEDCGTISLSKKYLDLSAPDNEWRKVEIRGCQGYASTYIEMNGKMLRTATVRPSGDFRLCGYRLGGADGVEFRNVCIGPFDPKTRLPKPVKSGFSVLEAPRTIDIPVSGDVTRFSFVPGGYPVKVRATFHSGATNVSEIVFRSFRQDFRLGKTKPPELVELAKRKSDVLAVEMNGNVHIQDSGMEFSGGGQKPILYTIPRFFCRYTDPEIVEMLTNLTAYGECASRHVFRVELVRRDNQNLVYVDDNYLCTLPSSEKVSKIDLRLPAEAQWRLDKGEAKRKSNPYVERVRFSKPFATSLCRPGLGSFALECDGYLSRESTDNLPHSCLKRVPLGTYLGARVRYRLGGDTNRNTVLTARLSNLTSFNTAGRNHMSMTQEKKVLPRTEKGEGVSVFHFDPGKIQDVIWQRGFKSLDFEVLGDNKTVHNYFDYDYFKPQGTSDVIVVGAELIRSPAGMCVENGIFDNLFLPHEEPFFKVTLEAVLKGRYTVDWTVSDIDGKTLENKRETFDLGAGERKECRRAFVRRGPGWYGVRSVLREESGRDLVVRDTAYVELAEDTRKAGYESPFYTWNPLRGHVSDRQQFEIWMEHAHRCGVRHAQMGKFDEKDAQKWGITLSPLPKVGYSNKPTLAEREAEYEKAIDEQMRRYPHASAATIYHEEYPKQRLGDPGADKVAAEEVRKGVEICRVWRRKYPHVRLVVGNTGDGHGKMDQLLSAGFPKDLIDSFGEESVAGVLPPEFVVADHFASLKKRAAKYGYDSLPIEPCFEWHSRQLRNFPSRRLAAAYSARDALIALAWGAKNITIAISDEPDTSYFNGSWAGGSFSQLPAMTPYPAAAAMPVLTRLMDRVTFVRRISTGSQSVPGIEFRYPDGTYISAFWTERGMTDVRVKGSSSGLLEISLYGTERKHQGKDVTLRVGQESVYLKTAKPIETAVASKADRTYLFEDYPGKDKARTIARFDDPAVWSFVDGGMAGLNVKEISKLSLEKVLDPVHGAGLRLVRPEDETGERLGGLRSKKPIPIPEDVTTLGLWVKGNSSHGKIHFEVEDARGKVFVSTSRGWTYDWSNQIGLDYDGWRLVSIPISLKSPVRIFSPGDADLGHWRCTGNYKESELVYPLKFRAVSFVYGDERTVINETEKLAERSVSVGNLVAY